MSEKREYWGEEYNAKRRERYRIDSAYREHIKEVQREKRERAPKVNRVEVVKYANINGVDVEVFRVGTVLKEIGVSHKSLLNWEADGLIPKPTIEGVHRRYTRYQIELLSYFYQVMVSTRYFKRRSGVIAEASNKIHSDWSNT